MATAASEVNVAKPVRYTGAWRLSSTRPGAPRDTEQFALARGCRTIQRAFVRSFPSNTMCRSCSALCRSRQVRFSTSCWRVMYPATKRLSGWEATAFLAYDILQLAALYLAWRYRKSLRASVSAPVVISAATLEVASTVFLGELSFAAISALAQFHLPPPWSAGETFALPALYRDGIWVSLLSGHGFTSIYAWRTANEAARRRRLCRHSNWRWRARTGWQHWRAAAAAAHELGTPLATIALVARIWNANCRRFAAQRRFPLVAR